MPALLFLLLSLTRVADGDTVTIGKGQRVRLYGIDAPERDQPGGAEATAALRELLARQIDSMEILDQDRYGRWVAVIHTKDGTNVNLEMIRAGQAWFYAHHCTKQPVCSDFQAAEAEARAENRGLWQSPNPRPPWKWPRK